MFVVRQGTVALHDIPIEELVEVRRLGVGSFGAVMECVWSGGGGISVAVKANDVNCADVGAIENERRLLELMSRHPHENVVEVYGLCQDAPDGMLRLVMKLYAGGSLDKYLSQRWERGVVGEGRVVRVRELLLVCCFRCCWGLWSGHCVFAVVVSAAGGWYGVRDIATSCGGAVSSASIGHHPSGRSWRERVDCGSRSVAGSVVGPGSSASDVELVEWVTREAIATECVGRVRVDSGDCVTR